MASNFPCKRRRKKEGRKMTMNNIMQSLKGLSAFEFVAMFVVVGTVASIMWWLVQWLIVVIAGLLQKKRIEK